MNKRSAVVVAGAMAVVPAQAHADEFDDQPPCSVEATDVVGYRECPAYGMWGSNLRDTYVFLDVGVTMRHFASRGSSDTTARSTSPIGTSEGGDDAYLFDERIGFVLTHNLYTAVDFELGDITDSRPTRSDAHAIVVDGLVSVGLRGGLGPFVLQGELAGGAMAASSTTRDLPTEAMFEARGRADLWLSPWVTVGAALGASLIRQGDWMAGLYLGFHTWSFGGDRW
jgi:hypothetical protein